MTNRDYRAWLIDEILRMQTHNQFTREVLSKKPIHALELIYDNIE